MYIYVNSAAQMWLCGRLLPALFGFAVPEGDDRWENLLVLLKICEYLFAPVLSSDDLGYLKVLVHQHHCEFVRLYPDNSVTPKLHYMVHMARLIQQ